MLMHSDHSIRQILPPRGTVRDGLSWPLLEICRQGLTVVLCILAIDCKGLRDEEGGCGL